MPYDEIEADDRDSMATDVSQEIDLCVCERCGTYYVPTQRMIAQNGWREAYAQCPRCIKL